MDEEETRAAAPAAESAAARVGRAVQPPGAATAADTAGAPDLEVPAGPDGEHGLGLAATAERLQLLYGDAQTFSAANAPGGGFLVRITLPARTAQPGAAAATPATDATETFAERAPVHP
jgi:hypothetical protein